MHPNPTVSEFSLAQPPPQVLIRSRFKDSPRSAFSRSACSPNDIIVNVRPLNPLAVGSQVAVEVNVRADIDACLSAVEVAYGEMNKAQQNFIPLQRSRISEEAIHRIDNSIVMDYVTTVYRDYGIRNRFGQFDPLQLQMRSSGAAVGVGVRPVEGVFRQERTSSSRPSKQFLNVTQESKHGRRQASFSTHRNEIPVTVRPHRHTLSSHASPVDPPRPSTSRLPQTSTKRSQLVGRAREDFRYCVNCQRAVLSLNSDFHEQYECAGFQQLYTLSFGQLAERVEGKAQRVREELRGKLRALREEVGGQSRVNAIAGGLVELMEDYARDERVEVQSIKDEIREEQRRLKYNLFRESQNNLYSEAVELTHKLHWFQQISLRLREEQGKTHESTTKTEEGRALQYMRTLTPTQRPVQSTFSPVSYLHPHLHRFARP